MEITQSLYEILGVPQDASKEDIKLAYKKLAKILHPDAGAGGDEEKFKKLSEAYEVLSDTTRRERYDLTGEVRVHDLEIRIRDFMITEIIPPILLADDITTVRILGQVKTMITGKIAKVTKDLMASRRKLDKLELVLERLSLNKDEDNEDDLLRDTIRLMMKEVNSDIHMLKEDTTVYHAVSAYLDRYDYDLTKLTEKFKDANTRKSSKTGFSSFTSA